jgi:protein SCO1/2
MGHWKSSAAFVAAASLLAVFCSHAQPSAVAPSNAATAALPRYFDAKGVVQKLEADGKTVVIQHDAIPGYMAAMTMPFAVNNPNELRDLQPGDTITFRVVVTDQNGWIDHVVKADTAPVPYASLPSFVHVIPDVDLLKTNEVLPDTRLTNELGQVISTGQFRGQALAFTFFFTRCPYPNFCPFLSSSFEEAQKKLTALSNGPANWHLLSISFDPDYDSPATLKAYALAHDYDPAHWTFASGNLTDLIVLGDRFGEYFGHDSSGGMTHNLRTVVLDTEGRLRKVFIGNSWTSDELVAEIIKATRPQ